MRIALLGDMAFYGKYSVANGKEVFEYFSDIAEYLSAFDHVIGNLETPLCEGLEPWGQKSAHIRATPGNTELLRFLNVTTVNLANNHIFDYGPQGCEQTIKALERSSIDHFGVDGRTVVLQDDSARVALHGYCSFNTNPLGVSNRFGTGLNFLNVGVVRDALAEHDRKGRLNVVSMHSGQEHVNFPSRDDITMARMFAETCPYVYYGHHPHVMQGYELHNDSLIAYSLGNFCFDDLYTDKSPLPLIKQSDNNKAGMLLELEIEGKQVVSQKSVTIFTGDDGVRRDPEGLTDALARYSEALAEEPGRYDRHRARLIEEYLHGRRRMRDLQWYVRRLNLTSVGIILRGRLNRYRYRKNVSRFLPSQADA